MATSEAAPVDVPTYGRSSSRRVFGLIGQYGLLVALSVLVVGPLVLTVFQAMSPPFIWVDRGRPWHPVDVAWKDRTWWTGGALSVVVRTLVVIALLAWLQKVAADRGWRPFSTLATPARVGAVVGGTLVFAFAMGAVFASFHDADGRSGIVLVVAGLAVAATQVLGFRSSGQTW
ncbi:MAG: hypothetical protein KDA97_08905, partial [Acidimicrobiales bacterium]|nr:hypothetical protein [Acidimicrobiales bacterium]